MTKRWHAIVAYDDLKFDEYGFDEFSELGAFIEGGPNFYTIQHISIAIDPDVDRKSFLDRSDDTFKPIGKAALRLVDKLRERS